MDILSKKFKKGFTLIEIIIAVVIFLVIILIFIQVFSSIIRQSRASIEKARMNEYISLIEKTIKDELNASNLEVDPDTWRILENSNAIVNPKFYPTCVIQPNIFQQSININQSPLVYTYPTQNNQRNTLAALRVDQTNQRIIKTILNVNNINSLPLTLINVVNPMNNRQIRWYYVLNQNGTGSTSFSNNENLNIITTPQNNVNWNGIGNELINLSNQVPQYERNSSYRISVVVSRIRINPTDTTLILHGTYWTNTPNNRIFDPIKLMIYTSIWIERNNQPNRRILETKRSFLINLKYKRII